MTPSTGGYLTAYSPDVARPATSTLNLHAGTTRANNAVQPISADGFGSVAFFLSSGSADLVVDVNGYFAPPSSLPADPGTVAPPTDPTVPTDPYTASQFLYTTDPPIQTGVAPGTIEPARVAILVGTVLQSGGAPLSGARITILRHPELGSTLSRTDGKFDLAVNGGGALVVRYEKAGFDDVQGIWVPLANGRVLKILGDDGQGAALLDLDGSGQPAGEEALLAFGISVQERRALLTVYPAGKTLWRVALNHFSKVDYNFPPNPPP
ncbi:MAG TPA: hypothetical protein VGK45_06885, partial [Thermoanaerobaculia bacterium]